MKTLLNNAFPTIDGPSDALNRRIAALADQHERRTARGRIVRQRVRIGFALAGATAGVAATLVAGPRVAAAVALNRIADAAESARTAHAVTFRIEDDGRRTRIRENWMTRDGRSRSETPNDIQIFTNGTLSTFEPTANVVRVRRKKNGPAEYNASGFSLGAMARDFARWGWTGQMRIGGETTIEGKRARQVVVQRGSVGERVVLYADLVTDLPFRADVQRETGDGWRTEMTTEVAYDEPLAAALFQPEAAFPATARRVDSDRTRQDWERKLARGLARQPVFGGEFVVRDVQMNGRGDVFVLYTDSDRLGVNPSTGWEELRPDAFRTGELTLTDDQGNEYLRHGDFQAFTLHTVPQPKKWHGFAFDGGRMLKAEWWTPVTPPRSGKPLSPRRITLTVDATDLKPDPERRRLTFTHRLDAPASALVPEYIPAIGQGPWQPTDIVAGALRVRAAHLANSGDAADREKALALYAEQIRVEDDGARAHGNTMVHANTWFEIYKLQRGLGRTDAARDALKRAEDDDLYHNLSRAIADAKREID